MNTTQSETNDILHLIDSLEHFIDAGIDPAFDNEYDELERQFAELRLGNAWN